MSELFKTYLFIQIAAALAVGAVLWAPAPATSPQIFDDQGEPFFSQWTDPLEAASLEVIEYNEQTASARPFKVQVKEGIWTIPSHHDYPADGQDRLAKTAASLIDLEKDKIRSDRIQDHEEFGVVDPLDEKIATLKGRGTRVTVRDASGKILADLILGRKVEGREGFRYVRVPGQKRTYEVRMDAEPSSKFSDWIETDLLQTEGYRIGGLTFHNYSVDEMTRSVAQAEAVTVLRDPDTSRWVSDRTPQGQEVNEETVQEVVDTLDDLALTDVRPKPKSMANALKADQPIRESSETVISLAERGFFLGEGGRIFANEGELRAADEEGVVYTLRFGEVVADSMGTKPEAQENGESAPAEDRYLFLTAQFDESKVRKPEGLKEQDSPVEAPAEEEQGPAEPENPADVENGEDEEQKSLRQEYEDRINRGKKRARELRLRFADWYYVISGDSYHSLKQTPDDLFRPKTETE